MARLWQALHSRFPLCPLVAALAVAGGACSMPIGSLNGKDEDKAAAEHTGSIAATPASRPPLRRAEGPAEADLAIARATVSEVLGRGGKDASAPWENPQTGARGTVTPVASSYYAGRLHLPRFPRELRARRYRKPGCRARPAACIRGAGKCAV